MYLQLRSFDNYMYANILLNRLKDHGFDCYLKDENTVTIDPLLSPAIGGIKLMVRESEAARARAFLDQVEAEYVATIACPKCGQKALQILKKTNKPKNFIGALLAQLFLGSAEQEEWFYRCSNCGNTVDEMPVGDADI
jgi:DNA-directed RNA polymerase subunit RPC12/RpoP